MKKLITFCLLLLSIYIPAKAQTYPEMIQVEAGTFTMGDAENEGEANERPTHKVTLKAFKIAKTETTVAEWRTYCTSTGRAMPEAPSWDWIDNQPIVNVTWQNAVAYCNWLSKKMNADYRLPTEAEWEYAARGGQLSKGSLYSGTGLDNSCWYEANSGNRPHAVATKNPNELGLYDMSGNVWEWCKDWYGPYTSDAKTNPTGATTGTYRVLRGGSLGNTASSCRVANRNNRSPGYGFNSNGFRVALSK